MTQLEEGKLAGSGGRTVIVGVRLDSESRELLTWAMVKVAQPGDTVIALHILANDEVVDRDGRSSLLSLVKTFDSVLAVYEGFCNLKQVDLKMKICRGSSIRKVLVSEAKSYSAAKIIVGTSRTHHTIRSPTSLAKYCAKKLPKDCSVLAVNNGKVVFHNEGSNAKIGIDGNKHNGILKAIQRSISLGKNARVTSDNGKLETSKNEDQFLEQALVKARPNSLGSVMKQNCSICGEFGKSVDTSCTQSADDSFNLGGNDENYLALVVAPPSTMPELKPGWPLLRHTIFHGRQTSDRSLVRKMSVVQWAMRLPSRKLPLCLPDLDSKQSSLDSESGAIVPVDTESLQVPSSPDYSSKSLPDELKGFHEKYSATCRLFNYQEVLSATSNFSSENLVGKGGSSEVYKGCLPDGKELAVKILKQSEDALKEFVLEIEIITTLNHKNIISLLGFGYEDNHLILVYDFLSRGSLEENLHGYRKDPLAFGWSERYKVAVGVAEALDYLHRCSAQPVIHRDVKSSNILLSDDFEPQLSDFGLAKWAPTSSSHIICSDVAGTFGYLAPEYFMYGKVNEKIDVYAFGVVLLELLSGKKPISNDLPKGKESLVMWAKPILNDGKISQLLDPSLGDGYDHDQMESMVLAATLCVNRSPRARPQMNIVVKLLQGDSEVKKWAKLQVNNLEESDMLDDETCPAITNLQSHLNLALLDVEDDSLSTSSVEQPVSFEEYLRGRCSRSSSFD